jgi:hypothetical protein
MQQAMSTARKDLKLLLVPNIRVNANLTVPSYCVTIVIRNYAVKRFSFTCQTRSNLKLGIWMPFRERLKSNYNK